ncbi:hypothetical protein DVH24_032926 [Malus domestica]|uniref:F-box domain-containing protein n=1 Tax=Malus domestica TaxID=3750 RepID=A0A498IRW6_MALDO|nr:hypothetical protein DVH24_032926 [Malus domestica]
MTIKELKEETTKLNVANGSGGLLNQPPSNHYISEDILVEILSRLPAKSLQRFRCVCKPWGALVSNSDFLKHPIACIHTELVSLNLADFRRWCLIQVSRNQNM